MATCKDCLHHEACAAFSKLIHSARDVDSGCEHFKEKARFVELPCSYDATVYAVGEKKIITCEVNEICFTAFGLMYMVSFDCDSDCNGCPFNSWKQEYVSGEWSCDGEYGQAAVSSGHFGKTVFLSIEEAEAALVLRKEN